MNNIEDFIRFTDNGLSDSEEQVFSEKLANDTEYRSDFKSYLIVKNSIDNFVANAELPADAKVKFFNAVGLDIENGIVQKNRRFAGRLIKVLTLLSIFFLFSLIIVLFVLPNTDLRNNEEYKAHNGAQKSAILLQNGRVLAKEIPIISSYQNEEKSNINPIKKSIGQKYCTDGKHDTINLRIADNSSQFKSRQAAAEVNLLEKSSVNNVNLAEIETNSAISPNLPFIKESNNFNNINFPENISIQAAYSTNQLIQKPTISPKQRLFYNNMSIALLYGISDEFTTGIEVKAENFFLRYHEKNDFGTGYTYELQPNLNTISALIRYSPIEIQSFKPFIQISIGTNQVGYVSREIIGLIWAADENLSLFVNAGLSNLFYNRKEGNFSSAYYGLQYGLIYEY